MARESEDLFHFHFYVGLTYYISLYVGETTGPRDGHVITVSGCLILTAVNSSSYGWLTKC